MSTRRAGFTKAEAATGAATYLFDDYASVRTTAIGLLLTGDANGDDTINIIDAAAIRNEILANQLNSGIPDCNGDGTVSIRDSVCVMKQVLSAKTLSSVRALAKSLHFLFMDSFESGF